MIEMNAKTLESLLQP